MREIEFRGKRIDNGEWIYGNLMQFEDSATFIFADERKGASTLTYAHFIINNMHAIDEKTVGQYTGLKDKNGKKIFEGDIVINSKGQIGYIAFLIQEADFVVVLKNSDYSLGHRNTNECYERATHHKIIGNIHENPELMEGTVNEK
ncbi:TPA: hypothetical protein RF372_000596 [Listeria monocytogenes]|uniref:YopX family protein n=1 Tax=Listeria monocytogenes TaxID=1639 RepID=UPI001772842E|nr:YopX family protein [Listeria monocytogenes]HAA6049822.1 hypothetical protein [Listeria monocytogenes]HAA9069259.1 hypothetical protein [Listeria monocytogenes]HDT9268538.1 hypothetical protein [Listeria monocytogenes]HDU0303097.1 hypothetical protein [Listeria monocytogenes]HDU7328225.1 hypothetical protein [Listeria monocytogenes]